jgi:hypothetical protein
MSLSILFANILGLLAIYRNRGCKSRMIAILIVLIIQAVYFPIGCAIDDAWVYYISAAAADVFVVCLLASVQYSSLSEDLQLISLTSSVVNLWGLLAYESYISSSFYNTAMTTLLVIQLIRMNKVTWDDRVSKYIEDTFRGRWNTWTRGKWSERSEQR